jgi:hypothetical protein
MSTDVNLSKDDREAILTALNYWVDNISQEETDSDTFFTMLKLQKLFRKLTPWRP